MKYSDSIYRDLSEGFISVLQKGDHERQDIWYLTHHPVVNPKKPEQVRSVGCATKKFLMILPE